MMASLASTLSGTAGGEPLHNVGQLERLMDEFNAEYREILLRTIAAVRKREGYALGDDCSGDGSGDGGDNAVTDGGVADGALEGKTDTGIDADPSRYTASGEFGVIPTTTEILTRSALYFSISLVIHSIIRLWLGVNAISHSLLSIRVGRAGGGALENGGGRGESKEGASGGEGGSTGGRGGGDSSEGIGGGRSGSSGDHDDRSSSSNSRQGLIGSTRSVAGKEGGSRFPGGTTGKDATSRGGAKGGGMLARSFSKALQRHEYTHASSGPMTRTFVNNDGGKKEKDDLDGGEGGGVAVAGKNRVGSGERNREAGAGCRVACEACPRTMWQTMGVSSKNT